MRNPIVMNSSQSSNPAAKMLHGIKKHWARPEVRSVVYLLLIIAAIAAYKLEFTAHTYTTGIDGGYYTDIAKHVRDGEGLTTNISLYNKAYEYFPHPTAVYPVWPLVYGGMARVFPLLEVGRWVPMLLYFLALLGAYFWARRVWPADLIEQIPGFGAAHVIVLIVGLHSKFFLCTSRPYTEGLAYALLFAALWRFERLWARPGWIAGLEAGAWLGLIVLTRFQLVILVIAAFLVLAIAIAAGPSRKPYVAMAVAAGTVFGCLLLPYAFWVKTFIPDLDLLGLLSFYQNCPNDLLPPVDALVKVDSLGALVSELWLGLQEAFRSYSEFSYQRTFHGFQYAVVAALPFLVAAGIAHLRSTSVGDILRRLSHPENLNRVFIVVFALGGFVSIHLVHKQAWFEWNFPKRQALTSSFLFLICLLYLLRHRRILPTVLGVFILCAATYVGYTSIVETTEVTIERSDERWTYKAKLVDWLDDARPSGRALVVAAPAGVPQRMAVFTEDIHYHWLSKMIPLADLVRLVDNRDVDYVLLPARHQDDWKVFRDRAAFDAEFEQVNEAVSGLIVYARQLQDRMNGPQEGAGGP